MAYLNIKEEKLLPVVVELNTLLADYHMYYQKLRNFHWNILGKNFFELHQKFEELYGDARIKIDEIAERVLTLRYHPLSNYSDYLKTSAIEESESFLNDREMVSEILGSHKILLSQMSKVIQAANTIEDEGTVDLIGAYIRDLEKTSWMLDAWLKDSSDHLKSVAQGS
ncbi:starvation-inducible DNA-binding protein [Arenibacter nanhaiticus]|uniref:Starvation-inducible DNA-binding protein n=1 Tax=Arenibacter nanhaiticus TaxID=558155 RepID=A0A1M6FV01_9FLAO|nr:DNA starvation/stationary phase protection protein [Arenibacter nanhaiticus]SHJ01517.1 starvation-inducible DNA-binding protein [Arenibacter nanhaiticus]